MDALIRWLDGELGRRVRLGELIGLTRSGVSQMLRAEYIPMKYAIQIHEFTDIPFRYLVRKQDTGLTEGELAELDQIARAKEIKEAEKKK